MKAFFSHLGVQIQQLPALAIGVSASLLLICIALLSYRRWRDGQGDMAVLSEQRKLQQRISRVEVELTFSEQDRQRLTGLEAMQLAQLKALQADLSTQQRSYAELEARTQAERRAMEEKNSLLQQNRQQLTADFENLANKIFEEKTEKFSRSSREMLDGTLAPLKQELNSFRKKVDDVYSSESKERYLLKEQIVQLREESLRISEDANNLTRALKQDNKAQGNWGELTLIRALEMCGLREPEEYQTQVALRSEDGSRQIPDVVVNLPGGKDVIIDSKVSLVAYTRYFEAEDEVAREQALKEHIASIRTHIKQLSNKNYADLLGVNTLDYVMLYIPIEGASALALQNDHTIWGDAYNKNIVLVSPTNLLAILRSVETIWRHERQNKNAERIAAEAGRLYDHFTLFAQSMEDIGRHLGRAQQAYETSLSRLVEGRGNLLRRVSKLKALGAKTSKPLPEALAAAAELDEEATEEQASALPDGVAEH